MISDVKPIIYILHLNSSLVIGIDPGVCPMQPKPGKATQDVVVDGGLGGGAAISLGRRY